MTTPSEYRLQGQIDRINGKARYYGCHTGMRSTRDWAITEYQLGWDEVDNALTRILHDDQFVNG